MRELPRGDRAIHGDHKEVIKDTTISKITYPTQEAKSSKGTGVGVSQGKGAREKDWEPREKTYWSSRYWQSPKGNI